MKILVADDEDIFRKLVVDFLKKDGYEVIEACDGRSALLTFQKTDDIDLCILDVMMPEINGVDVCKRIKTSPNPSLVLILTAKDRDEDQIEAFEAGADDYISKPFSFPILLLRVKALLKRNLKEENLVYNDLSIDIQKHIVMKNDKYIDLTPKEFELLVYLIKNKGSVISRENILSNIWGYDFFGDNRTVDTHVKNLRSKIGDDVIATIRGYGYVVK